MQELSKMQNIKIDWKWVFHTKTHHCVLINMNEKNFSSFWKQYYEDINKIEKFVILVPYVGVTLTPMEIARKYGLMLKDFFDSKKTTLIINEHVLNVLIKEETKSNFFKFLAKKNKNIIIGDLSNLFKLTPKKKPRGLILGFFFLIKFHYHILQFL